MLDQTVSLGITEAYLKLKETLASKGCRTVSEDPPKPYSCSAGFAVGNNADKRQENIKLQLNPC